LIIPALCKYYDILASDEAVQIPKKGYSNAKVSFVLVIGSEGQLDHIIDLRSDEKKPRPREMNVPKQDSRTTAIAPHFLCENAKYIFGVEIKNGKDRQKALSSPGELISVLNDENDDLICILKRTAECFQEFKALHHKVLDHLPDAPVHSFLKFLDSWNPEHFLMNPKISQYRDDLLAGGYCVFESGGVFLHQIPDVRKAWESIGSGGDEHLFSAQCLVTGDDQPISRTHQKIKGVIDAQPAGASLVSFNNDAFCSYRKDQSYNAPIGESSEFKYTTVLNYLLANKQNKIHILDTTTIFWAETRGNTCEDLVQFFLNPSISPEPDPDQNSQDQVLSNDPKTRQQITDILSKVKKGSQLSETDIGINPDVNFYILGLSPNNARISVRFWYKDHFGNFIDRIARHYLDMDIIRDERDPPFASIYWLLRETARKDADPSPILSGLLMNAILNNAMYPVQMYTAILNRVRVENSINYARAGFIKAYLLRLSRSGHSCVKEGMIQMSLQEENSNIPYRLGRLFSVLEKVQTETNRDLGSTITSKYFSSASATPAVVFPVLLKLAQHHIAKSEWGFKTTKSIEEILSGVDQFPAYLTLEEQGMFMLGYYHQRKALFQKKETKIDAESVEND
jgi:CRISPR-associated protein Csd1